jgi:hypothetical protein
MDQRLLDALNNLSFALEEISEALKDKKGKKSDTTTALQSGNFSKTIQEIHVGIKSIKKDTEEILKQQKTIIELSKKKSSDKKTGAFESDPKKESSIKKGVTSIILIAAGVLAIGLAFKLVGKVDFLSVVGLGIGIYTVASAFEKIGRLKNLSYKKVLMISAVMPLMGMGIWLASQFLSRVKPMSLGQIITSIGIAGAFYFIAPVITSMMDAMMSPTEVIMPGGKKIKTSKFDMARLKATIVSLPILMIAMSLGITMSSWILSGVKPMGLGQIITAIAIAGMFSIAAMGIKGLIHALTEETETKGPNGFKSKKMDISKLTKIAIFLPIVMMAIALGITLSSYILSGIKPIGLFQAITAILIAGMFAVVSWGISKMLTALKDLDTSKMLKAIIFLPLLLPALALAITVSSWILSKVKPITFSQFLTGLAISVLFIAFSVTLLILSKADIFGKIKMRDVIMIPLTFVALSTAIMLSSWILSVSAEISFGRSLEILAFSVVLCIAVIVVAITLKILTKIGSVDDYIEGGISMVVIAASIMATSLIIALGNYSKYPSWKWALGVGLSLAAFGIGAALLGPMVFGPQALVFLAGLAAILVVALTVVGASHILALGNYKKYPTVTWALGVGLALGGFGVGAVLLGTQVLNPFFYGGLGMVLVVAATVVAASHILNKGNYSKYPTASWVGGVGLALGAFGAGAVLLGFNVLNPFFYAGLKMILSVARTIVASSFILATGKWDKGPTQKWAAGVAAVFKAFKPVFDISSGFSGLFGGGFASINRSMMGIVNSMVSISKKFANSSNWKYPPLQWGQGVSQNMRRYVNLSNYVFSELDFLSYHSVRNMASEMVVTAKILSKGKNDFSFVIPENFMKNLATNMLRYARLSRELDKIMTIKEVHSISAGLFGLGGSLSYTTTRTADMSIVNKVASQMVITAAIMSKGAKFMNIDINPNYMKNLSGNILYYAKLSAILRKEQTGTNFVKNLFFGDPISNVANGMVKLAIAYDRLGKSLRNFGSALRGMDSRKLNEFRGMTSNIAVLSALDSKMFDNMLTVLETRSSVFAKMLNAQAPAPTRRGSVKVDKRGDKQAVQKKGKHGDSHRQMDVLIELMGILVTQIGSGSTLDEFLQKKLNEKKGSSDD